MGHQIKIGERWRGYTGMMAAAVVMTLAFPMEATIAAERAPLCSIEQARANGVGSIEQGFRRAFCSAVNAPSCTERWTNAKLFLDRALADDRIDAVGTIAYMFGTIYVETAIANFSPATRERIGSLNRDKDYVKEGYFGRGWIQLTYRDKYALAGNVIGKDAVKQPSLVEQPDHAYRILYQGMTDGWIENYRTSSNGAADPNHRTPIKLGDFVTAEKVDYDLARAVINANCKKAGDGANRRCSPPNIMLRENRYIPPPASLDAGPTAARMATKMEQLLCTGAGAQH